jgi:hypothetical protein
MFKYQDIKTGKIVTRKRKVENPSSKGLKPIGWIRNILLSRRDIIGK